VLEWISKVKEDDFASGAFVLGIENSGVLSRLAGFAQRILGDNGLAEALARVAVKMGPQNPVALTYLARILAAKNERSSLIEAEKIIEKVPNFADRRFRWWRPVRRNIRAQLYQKASTPEPKRLTLCNAETVFTDFDQLIRCLDSLKALDVDNRQRQFAYIIKGLIRLSPGIELIRDRLAENGEMEVRFLNETLRIIPLWSGHQISATDVAPHLEHSGVAALVVSISEAAEDVTALISGRDTDVILVDHENCDKAIREYLNFDEVISRSLAHHRVLRLTHSAAGAASSPP
jgi:hypothetical protein